MNHIIICITFLLLTINGFSQIEATTNDGKKVILNPDRTWKYLSETEKSNPTSYVFAGEKKLTSGKSTIIHIEEYGLTSSISIAKDDEKTLIIFWQETTEKEMNFFNWLWTGNVILYLENGETVSLIDSDMKGQNKITDGHISSYGSKSDLYQRYSAYYLTSSDRLKLNQSNLSQISYQTTSSFEKGRTILEVSINSDTIKKQLQAINR